MSPVPILEEEDRVAGRPEATAWRRAVRLHQHMWREQNGWPAGAVRRPIWQGGGSRPTGSRIDELYAREKGVNFLTDAAFDAAVHRATRPQPFQTLDDARLFSDLLGSLAMSCNLFGPLAADERLAIAATERWFRNTGGTNEQCQVDFDWSPGRRSRRWLDDTTSFDVAFRLTGADGHRLIGLDARYHEQPEAPRSTTVTGDRTLTRRPPGRLLEVTEAAGLFKGSDWLGQVFGTDLEPIWRAHALAHAYQQGLDQVVSVLYVLVAPSGNPGWADLAARYGKLLTPQARPTFAFRTLEQLIDDAGSLLDYADDFTARYLKVSVAASVPRMGAAKRGTQQLFVIGEIDGHPAVRIGVSDRPRSRVSDFASGNPRELELLHAEGVQHARWLAYQLHAVLAPWRLLTNPEWYDVRHLVAADDWQDFIERALSGHIPDAEPSPTPEGVPGHEFLHVDGKLKAFVSSCSCNWHSDEGTIDAALDAFRAHAAANA